MDRTRREALLGAASAVVWLATGNARAAPESVHRRLERIRRSERYVLARKDDDVHAAGARIHVAAPADVVRSVVTDYRHYEDFIHGFRTTKVVGKRKGKTDVYLKVPILNGAGELWGLIRFAPPRADGPKTVVVGRLLEGNVELLRTTWHVRPIGEDDTQLDLVIHIGLDLPFASSIITKQVMRAADEAVTASRDRAERKTQQRR